jgi:hypothetical protein
MSRPHVGAHVARWGLGGMCIAISIPIFVIRRRDNCIELCLVNCSYVQVLWHCCIVLLYCMAVVCVSLNVQNC